MRSSDIEQGASHALTVFEIRLEGEFDLCERHRLTDAFAVAANAAVVVVNLDRTTYIDSTALQCLVALQIATQRREGVLVLTGVREAVLRLFEVTNLLEFFDVRDSISDLVKSNGQMRRLTLVSQPVHDSGSVVPE